MPSNSYLKRLPRGYYKGQAFVHWSMTIQNRSTGWISSDFHSKFREILLHSLARHHSLCPAYCLMPDHIHILSCGLSDDSDQIYCIQFIRRHLNKVLKQSGYELQDQAHDHVLTEEERMQDSFPTVANYIFENPVRNELKARTSEWPYSGALVPGYPDLDPFDQDYWDRFWKIYELETERRSRPAT